MDADDLEMPEMELNAIYHCCTHKSASQWFRFALGSPLIRKYQDLEAFHCLTQDPAARVTENYWTSPFSGPAPERKILTCLYIDHRVFDSLTKPSSWRGFFVMRDPRDIVVSRYYSALYSHALSGPGISPVNLEHREHLGRVDREEGLLFVLRHLHRVGLFDAQRSWMQAPPDPLVRVVRYEDLFGDRQTIAMREFLDHLDIPMTDEELEGWLDAFSFSRLTGGRSPGQTDALSHYRCGVWGQWREVFTSSLNKAFADLTGDLVKMLGYPA